MARYNDVRVYTTTFCGDCRRAKYWLDEHNIDYDEVNVDQDPGARNELQEKTGKLGVPYLVLDGEWIRGYKPGQGVDFSMYHKLFNE